MGEKGFQCVRNFRTYKKGPVRGWFSLLTIATGREYSLDVLRIIDLQGIFLFKPKPTTTENTPH